MRKGAVRDSVSIHAPVRERLNDVLYGVHLKGFNSRSREGATKKKQVYIGGA